MSKLENVTDSLLNLLGYIRDNFFRPAEQITRTRLSHVQFHAISILNLKGPLPMTELASEMKISKQQLTPLICKLIEADLVVRRTDGHDRRIVRIEMTETGRTAFNELGTEIKQFFRAKLRTLPEQELEELEQILTRTWEILKSVP